MGFAEFVSESIEYAAEEEAGSSSSSKGRATFQWGGTIFALFLLILNRTGPKSSMLTTLLVFYLFTSLPNVFFKIVRGSIGYWVSFLAVAAHLFFPKTFPVSRFVLFVITPDWVAKGLRDSSAGCIFCFIIAVLLVVYGALHGYQYNCHCFCYFLCIAFLIFFTSTLWW